jgi:aspartate aminotransferase
MFAQRLASISESATMKVAAEAERLRRAGRDVVDFSVGEPDFPTPEHIKEAGKAAIDANFTRYTPVAGVLELRQAICARYKADYGIDTTPAEVLLTVGGKQALFNAALALFDPGDEVITHAPYWPTIPEQVKLVGAHAVIVQTDWKDAFAVHADAMINAITPKTKAIVINSPANPSGALVDERTVAAIADEAAKRGIWIIVDLCYEHLIYEDVPHNLPKVLFDRHRERTVLACSASKAYAMTGWRCGWAIGPASVIGACNALQSHSTSNACSITQRAAEAALNGPQSYVTAMLDEYRDRRDRVCEWLAAEPRIRLVKPAGAFYLFPDVSEFLSPDGIRTTAQLGTALLDEARVAVTPGEAFDAPGFIRISYATSLDVLQRGTSRILEFMHALERKTTTA